MVRVEGHTGALRAGYQVAAQLGPWTLTVVEDEDCPGPRRYRYTARVLAVSDYWLTHTPISLSVDVGAARWTWPDVQPVIADQQITVSLTGTPSISVA